MDAYAPLARRTGESAADWSERLRDDLTARHQRAERIAVESYLDHLPTLAAASEVVLDLLVAEWTLRRQAGEEPALVEYVRRFPEWKEQVRELWEVDPKDRLL